MVDRHIFGRDRALATARARAGDRRRELLRRPRLDQCLHGCLPDPEPRPSARRRRRPVVCVRARLQRVAREGRAGAGVARRVDRLLALPAAGQRADRSLHPRGPGADATAHRRLRRPDGDAVADPLPDRRPARTHRDHHRDPEQLRRVLDPCSDPRGLEPRDHRRARDRRAPGRQRELEALRLRGLDRCRHPAPTAPAAPLAARPRRTAAARTRSPRPDGQAGLQADGPRHARPRADQRQRRDRNGRRRQMDRPDDRPDRDRQGLPDLHAAPGNVLGRRRDGALSLARPACDARRHGRLPRHARPRFAPDQLPPDPLRGDLRRPGRADRPAALRARCL